MKKIFDEVSLKETNRKSLANNIFMIMKLTQAEIVPWA